MKLKLQKAYLLIAIIFFQLQLIGQDLKRSTPEAEGVSSKAISEWVKSYQTEKHELHSIMVLRHGKVIAEAWSNPYAKNLKHTMYSVSKSWTSTAIGFLVDEGKLKVDDKVINFFPENQDIKTNKHLNDLRVKDLLMMAAGHSVEPIRGVVAFSDNWVRGFLSAKTDYEPGTHFLYNTLATYLLSAIVQKVSGEKTLDYLEQKLLKPLNIQQIDWETDPKGINVGGWGIRVKTEDMAKLGQFYLQKGKWHGKQLLSEKWISEATSKQIEQEPNARQSKKDSSDWLQGYGYQFWRCRNGAFRADGAFGQYIVVFPEKDAVAIITSESMDLQDDLNNIWAHLLPAFSDKKLPENPIALQQLKKELSNLKLNSPQSELPEHWQDFNPKKIKLSNNSLGFKSISISSENHSLTVEDASGLHTIAMKESDFSLSETSLKGPYLLRPAKNALEGIAPFKTAASYYWLKDGSLGMTIRYIESPHHWDLKLKKNGESYSLQVINSFDKLNPIEIKGE